MLIISYVLADVYFLHFGSLNILFPQIAPFLYRKYIQIQFSCLQVKLPP